MAYYGLLPGQKIIGGYAPPGAGGLRDGNIIVIEISDAPKKAPGTPRLAFFTYQGMSAGSQGYADANPPESDANIVVDWDPVTKKYIYTKVALPNTVLVDIYTVRNDAENNKKYKDIAYVDPNYIPEDAEPEYVPINTDYHMQEWPKTLVENLGAVNAVYELEGAIVLRDKSLFVSGMGYSPAKNYGKVFYWMTATVLIDGQVFMQKSLEPSGGAEAWPDNKFFPIGSANFDLPEPEFGQKTVLVLEGAYTYKNDSGNYIVPEEYYAKYEMNIDIRQKQKEEAPIL